MRITSARWYCNKSFTGRYLIFLLTKVMSYERHHISNYRHLDCLLNSLFKLTTTKISKLALFMHKYIIFLLITVTSYQHHHISNYWHICSTACSKWQQRKYQSFTLLVLCECTWQWPVNSPHKEPVIRKEFPCDYIVMWQLAKNTT